MFSLEIKIHPENLSYIQSAMEYNWFEECAYFISSYLVDATMTNYPRFVRGMHMYLICIYVFNFLHCCSY